jgi:hypothetical protein
MLQRIVRKVDLMPRETVDVQCSDLVQELTIKIPCRLAKRIKKYANETGADFTGVVIEALDVFLRERKER